jgi:hypothetical protein
VGTSAHRAGAVQAPPDAGAGSCPPTPSPAAAQTRGAAGGRNSGEGQVGSMQSLTKTLRALLNRGVAAAARVTASGSFTALHGQPAIIRGSVGRARARRKRCTICQPTRAGLQSTQGRRQAPGRKVIARPVARHPSNCAVNARGQRRLALGEPQQEACVPAQVVRRYPPR